MYLSEFHKIWLATGESPVYLEPAMANRHGLIAGATGCGKTTLASVIAHMTQAAFVKMNAVTSGVGDVREVLQKAAERRRMFGQSTYLLLDECHRWNKAQSDSILPAIERGVVRFIGSTTENPLMRI